MALSGLPNTCSQQLLLLLLLLVVLQVLSFTRVAALIALSSFLEATPL
jgi:hypothetical protein